MKTFKEYLYEEKSFNMDKFLTDCSFFLDQLKGSDGKFLYHGTVDQPESYDIRPFKYRESPKHTNIDAHNHLNEVFTDMFGWPIRNGLFTTGDYNTAKIYSKRSPVCIIFPIGKFDWVCGLSPELRDLTSYFEKTQMEISLADDNLTDALVMKRTLQHVEGAVRNMNWKHNEHLIQCIDSGHEIMIKGTKFYFIAAFSDLWMDVIRPKLKEIL